MHFRVLFWCLILGLSVNRFTSAQTNYSVASIPEGLKKNARSVIRLDKNTLELKSEGKAKLHIQMVVTVLNENGADDAVFQQLYDKFIKLNIDKATIYDENGEKIRNIPKGDIQDVSAFSGISSFEDNRVKIIDPEIRNYPFTVEYNYTLVYNGTLQLPTWNPYPDYNVAVQHSEMEVVVPDDMEIRYLEKNIAKPATPIKQEDGTHYLWEADNLNALKEEPFSTSLSDFTPTVFLGMNTFYIGGTKGNASTWLDFGKWIYSLTENRNELPPETVSRLKNMTSELDSDIKKVQLLYQYMQDNTRYFNVAIGLGGWQPIDAETVDRLGYGDCKALTNYMLAILKAVGIKSYYTVVNSGHSRQDILTDFPSNQFNHAFLCVPVEHDTLWLECTSQTEPCGFMGTYTDDRHVLVIKEDGGHLVKTRSYGVKDNSICTSAIVDLKAEGSGHVFFERTYKGFFYDYADHIYRSNDKDKKELMYKSIDIPHFTLVDYSHVPYKERIPWMEEKVNLELGNYATTMGSNIFLTLNLMNKIESVPKDLNERRSDIKIKRSSIEHDTIIYNLPDGYQVSSIPEKEYIESKFGKYSYEVQADGNRLVYIRSFELIKGTHSKEDYNQLVDFFEKILTADQKKVALKKI